MGTPNTTNGQDEFRRVLGPWSASALIAGTIIGAGIFLWPSNVAELLRHPAAILSVWVLGAAIAACGALCVAELAAAYPKTGGIYVYLDRAYGPYIAFLFSWAKLLIMRVGSVGIMVLAFAKFTKEFLGIPADFGSSALVSLDQAIALLAIFALTAINVAGVKIGSLVQNVLTSAKMLSLLAIVAVGAIYGLGMLEPHPIEIALAPAKQGSFVQFYMLALVAVLWSYGGWDESPYVAEEVIRPERNLPISILGGLGVVAVLYVAANAAYLAILTPDELAGSGGQTAISAMKRALGGGMGRAMALALMISTFGAANGMTLISARIAYATGRDNLFFQWFSHTHPRLKTPARGLFAMGLLYSAAILLIEEPINLLFYSGLAYWIFSGLVGLSVFVLRRREPQRERPFKVWGYPVIPVLFILASLGMIGSVIHADEKNALATVAILAAGSVVYGIQRMVGSARGGDDAGGERH